MTCPKWTRPFWGWIGFSLGKKEKSSYREPPELLRFGVRCLDNLFGDRHQPQLLLDGLGIFELHSHSLKIRPEFVKVSVHIEEMLPKADALLQKKSFFPLA